MSDLVLYHSPGSRSGRVKALLDLMKVPYTIVEVDLKSGANKKPEYLAIHPLGKVPALKHGKQVIIESGAIMLYLADLYPEAEMAPPPGSPERGRYYEWFLLSLATFEPAAMNAFQNPDNADAQANLKTMLRILDARLGEPYAMGNALTAVDVLVHGQLAFMANMGRLEDLPRAKAYYERLKNKIPDA
jgi:glutathione S-transferase